MNAYIRKPRWFVLSPLWCVAVVWAVLAAPAAAWQDAEEQVSVSDYGTVTLTVKDTDLAQVLEMLSIQSRKNIITSKSVSATISANLYDVTFYEALDAILRVNGFGYIEEGNFIYVYTGPELEEIKRSRRATESRVFTLQYLAATDAFEFITPLLSDAGQASFRGDVPGGFKPDIGDGGADSYAFTPTLVVNDFKDNLDDIGEVLAELDSPPTQVLVEATVLQTVLDEANAFGVDFSTVASFNFTDIITPLAPVTSLQAGGGENGFQPEDNKAVASQSTVGATTGRAGLKVGIITDDISIFVRVLDEVTDSTVLARPKIMCLNRQRAEVLVGARVGYLSTTATETSTTQSVEFLDTGIQLIFRPFVSTNGMVRMELAPSVSEASLRSVTDANGVIVTIPDELTNELTTNVRVPDGQTLVLGGLFKETNRITRRQVPILSDIPLLGEVFKGQDDDVERTEIIFLITPNIIDDSAIAGTGEDGLAYTDAAHVGARSGLLPFSRSRMVDNYNRNAIAAYSRGDAEQALYFTNMSLRLAPFQADMIRFRDQVTGGSVGAHEHSLMERVIRRELGPSHPSKGRPEANADDHGGIDGARIGAVPFDPVQLYNAEQSSGATAPMGSSMASATMAPAPASNMNMAPVTTAATVPPVTAAPPAAAMVVDATPSPMVQDDVYDDLFRSFFESLGVPELTPPSATPMAEVDADAEIPFDSFDTMIETTELAEVGGTEGYPQE